MAIDYDAVDYSQQPEQLADCKISKFFEDFVDMEAGNDGWFSGKVDSYDYESKYYRIIYDDGDKEDMTMKQVLVHRLLDE